MTWDAYNRRKEILHEVLAIAEQHRGDDVVAMLARTGHELPEGFGEIDLLLDAQLLWFQTLNSHIDRSMFLGPGTLESSAIGAWQAAAADLPALRRLLDAHAGRPELRVAFDREHTFLARAAGAAPDSVGLAAIGGAIKDRAIATMADQPSTAPRTPGFVARIREVLAA